MPKRFYKKAVKKTAIAKLTKKVNKVVRDLAPEKKHIYQEAAFTPPMSVEVFPTASVVHLGVINQGDNQYNRTGAKIRGQYANFRYSLVNFINATQINNTTCRVMVVFDKRSQNTDLALNATNMALLMRVSVVNGQYLTPNNLFNNEYKNRWVILYDKTHTIGGLSNGDDTSTYKHFNVRLKCPYVSQYDTEATAGALGDIASGTYYLIYKPEQTENLGALGPAPQMHYYWDYYFTDV